MNPSVRTRPGGIAAQPPVLRLAAFLLIVAAVIAGIAEANRHRPADTGVAPPRRDRLEAPAIRSVVLNLASVLERSFVSPEIGRRYAAMLRAGAARGRYDRLADRGTLAGTLTGDLQALAPDGHLHVFRRWPPPFDRPPPGAPPAIEEARWLAPAIAYLRPTVFNGSAAEVAAIRRYLAEHATARTLIFDMRVHQGGGLAEMDEIFAALFARPTRLAVLEIRADAAGHSPFRAGPHLRAVTGRPGTIRLEHWVSPQPGGGALRDARVYVLISGFTGSAAEHVPFVLQRTRRATLIGARTQGAGNYGGLQAIGQGMAAFVPIGLTLDPETGRGWEGVGVGPDVAVPARRALVEALARAGIAPAEAQLLSDSVEPGGVMELRPGRPGRRPSA